MWLAMQIYDIWSKPAARDGCRFKTDVQYFIRGIELHIMAWRPAWFSQLQEKSTLDPRRWKVQPESSNDVTSYKIQNARENDGGLIYRSSLFE